MKKTILLSWLICCTIWVMAQPQGEFKMPEVHPTYANINYAGDSLVGHQLDIFLPQNDAPKHKVIVVIYGSAWTSNCSKEMGYLCIGQPLVDAGYAVVSINHRSSSDAHYPAQINDVKAAIRFIRANAEKYHLDTSFVGITGFSSGGHLSAMAGVTNQIMTRTTGNTTIDVEGNIGGNLGLSSSVDAVVDWFGPVDMARMENCTTVKDGKSPEAALIGGAPAKMPDMVALISPQTYVTPVGPRFLVIHGDADDVVPYCQSERFAKALKDAGRLDQFITVPNGKHGPVTFNETTFKAMVNFFNKEANAKQ